MCIYEIIVCVYMRLVCVCVCPGLPVVTHSVVVGVVVVSLDPGQLLGQ